MQNTKHTDAESLQGIRRTLHESGSDRIVVPADQIDRYLKQQEAFARNAVIRNPDHWFCRAPRYAAQMLNGGS